MFYANCDNIPLIWVTFKIVLMINVAGIVKASGAMTNELSMRIFKLTNLNLFIPNQLKILAPFYWLVENACGMRIF